MEDANHGADLGRAAERAGNIVNQPAVIFRVRHGVWVLFGEQGQIGTPFAPSLDIERETARMAKMPSPTIAARTA
jgi:hypothetical protein